MLPRQHFCIRLAGSECISCLGCHAMPSHSMACACKFRCHRHVYTIHRRAHVWQALSSRKPIRKVACLHVIQPSSAGPRLGWSTCHAQDSRAHCMALKQACGLPLQFLRPLHTKCRMVALTLRCMLNGPLSTDSHLMASFMPQKVGAQSCMTQTIIYWRHCSQQQKCTSHGKRRPALAAVHSRTCSQKPSLPAL